MNNNYDDFTKDSSFMSTYAGRRYSKICNVIEQKIQLKKAEINAKKEKVAKLEKLKTHPFLMTIGYSTIYSIVISALSNDLSIIPGMSVLLLPLGFGSFFGTYMYIEKVQKKIKKETSDINTKQYFNSLNHAKSIAYDKTNEKYMDYLDSYYKNEEATIDNNEDIVEDENITKNDIVEDNEEVIDNNVAEDDNIIDENNNNNNAEEVKVVNNDEEEIKRILREIQKVHQKIVNDVKQEEAMVENSTLEEQNNKETKEDLLKQRDVLLSFKAQQAIDEIMNCDSKKLTRNK